MLVAHEIFCSDFILVEIILEKGSLKLLTLLFFSPPPYKSHFHCYRPQRNSAPPSPPPISSSTLPPSSITYHPQSKAILSSQFFPMQTALFVKVIFNSVPRAVMFWDFYLDSCCVYFCLYPFLIRFFYYSSIQSFLMINWFISWFI